MGGGGGEGGMGEGEGGESLTPCGGGKSSTCSCTDQLNHGKGPFSQSLCLFFEACFNDPLIFLYPASQEEEHVEELPVNEENGQLTAGYTTGNEKPSMSHFGFSPRLKAAYSYYCSEGVSISANGLRVDDQRGELWAAFEDFCDKADLFEQLAAFDKESFWADLEVLVRNFAGFQTGGIISLAYIHSEDDDDDIEDQNRVKEMLRECLSKHAAKRDLAYKRSLFSEDNFRKRIAKWRMAQTKLADLELPEELSLVSSDGFIYEIAMDEIITYIPI